MKVLDHTAYELSQVVKCHTQSVRTLDIHNNILLTGSTDKTAIVFHLVENQYIQVNHFKQFSDFILSVKINRFNDGFFIGSKDKNIYVLDSTGKCIQQLIGHTGPVCSISQIDADTLVSGSWDGTARIWDLKNGKQIRQFDGHSYAVAVLAIQQLDMLVTGSQNKSLNFFQLSTGELLKSISNAHGNIIRSVSHIEDVGVLTSSNDDKLKVWSFAGELIQELNGHEAFVFSGVSLSKNTYVSASEDHTMKIWSHQGSYTKSFLHPATLWDVAVNKNNQDIITACSDGHIRVFTQDIARKASAQEIEEHDAKALLVYVQGHHHIPKDELGKVPEADTRDNFVGNHDGQHKVFKRNDTHEIYEWSQVSKTWKKFIEPTDKKYYEGDSYFEEGEYDYLFDVVEGDGDPKKIPFNNTDNPQEAAQKFCKREGISEEKISQIVAFLVQNSDQPKQRL